MPYRSPTDWRFKVACTCTSISEERTILALIFSPRLVAEANIFRLFS